MRLSDIARASGVSILELATHVCTPRNLEALSRVVQLHAIQREMLLGQLKCKALGRLAELTDEVSAGSADEIRASEVMRKACVDILRYGTPVPGCAPGNAHTRIPSPPAQADTLSPLGEEKVLAFLERMGEEKYEEGEVYPQTDRGAQIAQMDQEENGNGYGYENANENGHEPQDPPRRASGSVELPPPELTIPTGKMPVPLYARRTISRTPARDNRILPDDAHPP